MKKLFSAMSYFFSAFLCAAVNATVLYQADFEQMTDVHFACVEKTIDHRIIYDLKQAEKLGMVVVHRSERSHFLEYNRSGVFSHIIELSVDKTDPGSGGLCMFSGGNLQIPIDREIQFTGFLFPVDVPPDIHFCMGIQFTFDHPQTGKRVSGSRHFAQTGITPDGWIAFRKNIRELTSSFRNPVLTGWIVQIRSHRAFHGQKIRFALDDISFDTSPAPLIADRDSIMKPQTILSRDPYVVNYRSLHDESPENRINLIRNGSFELGMTAFFPYVIRAVKQTGTTRLPDPETIFHIVSDSRAPHGNNLLRISRNGLPCRVYLRTTPVPIVEGEDYILSFYADATSNMSLKIVGKSVTLTPGWKRYTVLLPRIKSHSFRNKCYPGRLELCFEQTGSEDFSLDALQFQRVPLTPYTPAGILQVTAAPQARFGLAGEGEALRFQIECFNDSASVEDATLEYEIQDLFKRTLHSAKNKIKLGVNERKTFFVEAPAGTRYCRLVCRLAAERQPVQSFVTSAAAIPDLSAVSGNEFFGSCAIEGADPPNLKWTLELNRRLGMYFNVVYGINLNGQKDWKRRAVDRKKSLDDILRFHEESGFKVVLQDELLHPRSRPIEPTPELEKMIREYCRDKAAFTRKRVLAHNIFGEYMKFPLEKRLPLMKSVLQAARLGLREGDDQARLWAAGQDHMDTILTTYGALKKTGAFQFLDAVSIHPYDWGKNAMWHENMLELIRLVRKDAPERMLTGTEGGVAAADTLYWDDIAGESQVYTRVCSELQQAEYNIAMNLMMFASGAFLHNATFYPYEGAMQFRRYFHFVNSGNGLSPRPVYPAYAQMVSRLAGAAVIGEVEQRRENGLQIVLLRRAGQSFAALWRYDEYGKTMKMEIPLQTSEILAFNLVGETISLPATGNLTLELGRNVVWLYPKPGCSNKRFETALRGIRLFQPSIAVQPEKNGVNVTVVNPTTQELYDVLEAPELRLREPLRLGPGEKRTYRCSSFSFSPAGEAFSVKLGSLESSPMRMIQVVRAENPPLIDGSLEEFSGAAFYSPDPAKPTSLCLRGGTGAEYRGKDDLSGRLALLWDDQNLYLGAEIRDDVHCTPHTDPALYWANDALHLSFIMPGRPGSVQVEELSELAISHQRDKAVASRVMGEPVSLLPEVRAAVIRRGGTTFYEAAIPWRVLKSGFIPGHSPSPKFNFSFSDNDGIRVPGSPPLLKGYQKALQLNRGIADLKSSTDAAFLIFSPPQNREEAK